MSGTRQHAEWLQLIEISGPFLSMPVLERVFPQGLPVPADEPDIARSLRLAYAEWQAAQEGRQPDPAIHQAWLRYVLRNGLGLAAVPELVLEGQTVPPGLHALVPEQHETLRPDLVLVDPPTRGGKPRLLVAVLPPDQALEKPIPGRAWKATPAERMMVLLHGCGVRLGLVTNGEAWMLVDAPAGETTGYITWAAQLWLDERSTLRAFRALLGRERFFQAADSDTLEALLHESAGAQQEVTTQLGWQVRRAVAVLVQALDRADKDGQRALLADVDEAELYQAAVTVMMRLVLLLSAEERDLLLLGDPLYDEAYAASTLRAQLREAADRDGEDVLDLRYDAWSRLLATFRAIHCGITYPDLRLSAHGGSLFDPDRFPFLEGRERDSSWRETPAKPVPVSNRTVLHLLEALQQLEMKVSGGRETRLLSFRALDVEQIGHVYEGLLDHRARRAEEPMLGLIGAGEPDVALSKLEELAGKGIDALVAYLKEVTAKSENALRKLIDAQATGTSSPATSQRLLAACDSDAGLRDRVAPFAGLLREDTNGYPMAIAAGSFYVTKGVDRRTSGAHYTPRSLTEPIVQYTLEPLVYDGPVEGKPREKWVLKPAGDLLGLKICDMAMGSGAFLVQACRYLADRFWKRGSSARRRIPAVW